MKKIICLLIVVLLLPLNTAYAQPLTLSAKSAVLIEATSGAVIFEKNAHTVLPMASTTKIMTAIIAMQHFSFDDVITVSESNIRTHGSSMYLKAGEKLTVKELLYGLMLASGNDAALTLAEHTAGSEAQFAKLMNEKAKSMGLKSTSFENASGLDGENHYTTAYELALIAREALFIDELAEIMATKTVSVSYENKANCRHLKNHNKLLWTYDGAIGVKTGFTKKSGRCLVSAAERNGVKLIAVTLNAPDDWNDHKTLLDFGFSAVSRDTVKEKGESALTIPVISGELDCVSCVFSQDLFSYKIDGIQCGELIFEVPQFLYAPIKQGQIIGRAMICSGGRTISEAQLIADRDISIYVKEKSFIEKICDYLLSFFQVK